MSTTMLPFYRIEPDNSESCFLVELEGTLTPEQVDTVNQSLKPYFEYLPTHEVTFTSMLSGAQIGEVGPRLAIETPFSSGATEIMHQSGNPDVMRVEQLRRYLVPASVAVDEFLAELHDPVTECIHLERPSTFLVEADIPSVRVIPLLRQGIDVLRQFSQDENLGFNESQIKHIERIFIGMGKNPTDVALFQLAQMWSDHCRHLLFNAKLTIDGKQLPHTLFDLLRSPYQKIKGGGTDNVLIGFYDNASAITGCSVPLLVPSEPGFPCPYVMQEVTLHHILSGETHNYPAHVSPWPGCATEIGGEIRDQLGVGIGSDILYAGCGRVVGSLWFPNGYRIPGEVLKDRLDRYTYPPDKATPLKILTDGLSGWHYYANCFGKPCIYGFFYSGAVWLPRRGASDEIYYERVESLKPVCFGVSGGTVREEHLAKGLPTKGMVIVQIGGGSFRIGFCGGSGSSSVSGSNQAAFDLNAVQRGNPEMERRFYQVLLACIAMGKNNPIVSLHDQGAGGIANVLTELIEKCGGTLYIGAVNRGDPTMSDLEVWVCEYQERQGLVIAREDLEMFLAICERENCPCEVLGEVTGDGQLTVYSEASAEEVAQKDARPIIELDLAKVLADMPPIELSDTTREDVRLALDLPSDLTVEQAIWLVLRRSEVCCKREWIRTVDGSIGGQVVLNQYCGPYSTPVNDCGLVVLSPDGIVAQASSLGVAPFKTTLDPPAGGRMAIGEMITNLMGVGVISFEHIQCICNWMWPANITPPDGELARLVATVEGIKEALEELVIAIIGGKDSSSLATKVLDILVRSIETVVFSSIAHVPDYRVHVTPEIKLPGQSVLIHVDIANGQRRLGGSSLGQCFGQLGDVSPDLNEPALLKCAFNAVQELLRRGMITAGHDISDGGILTTVLEMCFAANCGIALELEGDHNALETCFAEELGYVMECPTESAVEVCRFLAKHDVPHQDLGFTVVSPEIQVVHNGDVVLECSTNELRRVWERTGNELQKLQMDPQVAKRQQHNTRVRRLHKYRLTFTPMPTPPAILEACDKHKALVVREQGSNGYLEMIAAWELAGFDVWEVHMNDLLSGKLKDFNSFRGLIFPGGFSYGDVLGAAVGWAKKIMQNPQLKQMFDEFFARNDTFSFGICNGAQLGLRCGWTPLPDLSQDQQPRFTMNQSGSFHHQWVSLRITDSPAIMLRGMVGSILGAYVANGEGRFNCDHAPEVFDDVISQGLAPIVYVDSRGQRTIAPPYSPSGSFVAGVCDPTGRHLYMMPHTLDRASRLYQLEYLPPEWQNLEAAPWLNMAQSARDWCDEH